MNRILQDWLTREVEKALMRGVTIMRLMSCHCLVKERLVLSSD
jgi:hypothetical protein